MENPSPGFEEAIKYTTLDMTASRNIVPSFFKENNLPIFGLDFSETVHHFLFNKERIMQQAIRGQILICRTLLR